ncbi:MAG: hypothetical protein ABIL25_06160 [candidate division WOR-3 bacterium]
MVRTVTRLWLPYCLTLLISGCMSSGLYETARTSPPGQLEHILAVELKADVRKLSGIPHLDWWSGDFHPAPMYALRLGLFRNCDLGLRLGLGAAGLSAKYTFWDGEPAFALVADAAGSFAILPMAFADTRKRLGGSLLVSGGTGVVGYAASLGAGYRREESSFEFGRSDEQSWDIIASGGLPLMLGDRVRIMPVLSAGVPVWTRYLEWDFAESTAVYPNPDVRRLTLSAGISVSLVAPRDDWEPWAPGR